MFIDNPTIPVRLEVLIDVAYLMRGRSFSKDTILELLQPSGLPDLSEDSNQAAHHLRAAEELRILSREDASNFRFTMSLPTSFNARDIIVKAFEENVLGNPDVEPWAGRFYSFLLIQRQDMVPSGDSSTEALLTRFREGLPHTVSPANPLNKTKLRNHLRWYQYVGLGWFDPATNFVPDPTPRIERALKLIFGKSKSLESTKFIRQLGRTCPELDTGDIFTEIAAAADLSAERTCTRAVAIALRVLERSKRIRLACPEDSTGWSLKLGGQARTSTQSDRFDRIELLA